MIDSAAEIREVFLNPGELHFGKGMTRISTLLGSCVSITLWHPRRHIGGMCHYMVGTRQRSQKMPLDGRFGSEAFALLLQRIRSAGTHPAEYEAKLFGGGNMVNGENGPMDIGLRNIEVGRSMLCQHGIVLNAEHVGGNGHRKLHFEIWSGHVWLAFPKGTNAVIRSPHA